MADAGGQDADEEAVWGWGGDGKRDALRGGRGWSGEVFLPCLHRLGECAAGHDGYRVSCRMCCERVKGIVYVCVCRCCLRFYGEGESRALSYACGVFLMGRSYTRRIDIGYRSTLY